MKSFHQLIVRKIKFRGIFLTKKIFQLQKFKKINLKVFKNKVELGAINRNNNKKKQTKIYSSRVDFFFIWTFFLTPF